VSAAGIAITLEAMVGYEFCYGLEIILVLATPAKMFPLLHSIPIYAEAEQLIAARSSVGLVTNWR
jgi:hypothetical protein